MYSSRELDDRVVSDNARKIVNIHVGGSTDRLTECVANAKTCIMLPALLPILSTHQKKVRRGTLLLLLTAG